MSFVGRHVCYSVPVKYFGPHEIDAKMPLYLGNERMYRIEGKYHLRNAINRCVYCVKQLGENENICRENFNLSKCIVRLLFVCLFAMWHRDEKEICHLRCANALKHKI